MLTRTPTSSPWFGFLRPMLSTTTYPIHPLPCPTPHKPVMRPPRPPRPSPDPGQHPKPLRTLQKREATYWVHSRRAGSLGGPWGGQRGRGDKKAEQVFFFFTSFTGRGVCGRGFPPGPLSGDHACPGALSPSSGGPCTSCPQEGSNPPQGWEAGPAGDRKGACLSLCGRPRPLLSEGDGTLGISAYTGSLGAEGLANPTPPHLGEGSVGQASVPAPLPWDGPLLRAQAVKRHSPGPLGSERMEGSASGPSPWPNAPPRPGGLAPALQEPSFSLSNQEDARLTGPSGPSP